MEMESETVLTSCSSQTQTGSPSPFPGHESPDLLHNTMTRPSHHPHRHSPGSTTVMIPNRIFVGGIDGMINENDLWHFFSQHGAVKEVKIVADRAGVPKGYGFVTFETQEDAQKILHDTNRVCFKDKMFNIGQAVHRQSAGRHAKYFPVVHSPGPGMAMPGPRATLYLTTANGYPYTYYNGVAYFQSLDMSTPAQHWPHSMSASPMLLPHPPQPIYQQTAYQHYQTSVASNPVMYMQSSEYVYQPTEQPSDGGCVQPAGPVLEATVPEQFMDYTVQPAIHQICTPTPGAMAPIVMQQEPGKEQTFHVVRPGNFHPLSVNLKLKYCPYRHANHYKDPIPETPEPTDPTTPPAAVTPQCIPNHLQWTVPQTSVASNPVMYMQSSEYVYQPTEQPSDGGCVQPAGPVLEATVPEQFMDYTVQPAIHQICTPTPGAMAPIVMQQEPGKEQTFHVVRPGNFHPLSVNLKLKYCPYRHANHYKDPIPETPEPTDPTTPPAAVTPQVG